MIKFGDFVRVALALCVLLVSSCVACGDYKYLGFASTPGVAVLETRVPELAGLRDVRPFPASYDLRRDNYRIILRVYERDSGPTVTFTVEASTPKTLQINEVPLGADNKSCIAHVEQGGGVKVTWLGWDGCKENESLVVVVMDKNGNQVAAEKFSFSVITNGRTCVKDGL